jgi:hypothetical protein
MESTGELLCLLREGDNAVGCDGARIGTIQAIELNPQNGNYFILSSLAGGLSSRNQALFAGDTNDAAAAQKRLRKPFLNLRKGQMVLGAFGGMSSIKTITPGTRGTDVTGASGKGLAEVVKSDDIGIKVLFSDGSLHAIGWDAP